MRPERGDGIRLDHRMRRRVDPEKDSIQDPPILHVRRQQAKRQFSRLGPGNPPLSASSTALWRHQHIALTVKGQSSDISQRLIVEICYADVDLEIVEGTLDLFRG